MDKVDCVVIGAGVVGLAVARQLALQGREVFILEAEDGFGYGISSRNSEVIHAGIYYPHNSLKALLCVEGRKRLYRYCNERGVNHSRCGKLIVATAVGQLTILREIEIRARKNGVDDVFHMSREMAIAMEPSLHCLGALYSPATGIVDSHALMISLLADAETAGAMLICRSPVIGGCKLEKSIQLKIGGRNPATILARTVINSTGLGAQAVARSIQGIDALTVPPLSYAKGNYFALSGKAPFSHLIYPVPVDGGLGVHLTLDLGHRARFGPDVEWVDTLDYTIDFSRGEQFYREIRRYWPDLPNGALSPAFTGIRPKPHFAGEAARDFIISGPKDHGVSGLVNLYGIESPGLTSCLAIAGYVSDLLSY